MTEQNRARQDQFILRLPDGMRDRLKLEAKKNGRSMNAEIIARLGGYGRPENTVPETTSPKAEKLQYDLSHLISELNLINTGEASGWTRDKPLYRKGPAVIWQNPKTGRWEVRLYGGPTDDLSTAWADFASDVEALHFANNTRFPEWAITPGEAIARRYEERRAASHIKPKKSDAI